MSREVLCTGKSTISVDAVVAIPVRNERDRIRTCLQALDEQIGLTSGRFGIVLFLNNCTDDTLSIALTFIRDMLMPVRLVYQDYAEANAGWARRAAMDEAASWLAEAASPNGCILTTDADTRVGQTWVRDNLAALAQGVDVVAGRFILEPLEAAALPTALHARGALESRYESLLVETFARLDPEEFNPYPNHWTASGATLAVRLRTYLAAGGMPALPVGEDRAFIAAVRATGGRVRHEPAIEVITSGRLDGRAVGGAADTMRARCLDLDALCDPRLETILHAFVRIFWRRYLRYLHARKLLSVRALWGPALGLKASVTSQIAAEPVFDCAYARIEAASHVLRYKALFPQELPRQIRRAETTVRVLNAYRRLQHARRRGGSLPYAIDASPSRSHPTFE